MVKAYSQLYNQFVFAVQKQD